jgi:hypothetical protein
MKQEIKKMWIDALRSGKYTQGHCQLIKYTHHTNKREEITIDIPTETELSVAKYCCLGVLCDLHRKVKGGNLTFGWRGIFYAHGIGLPPEIVLKWAGLEFENPQIEYNGKTYTLSELNDRQRLNFYQIADLIEQQL